MPPRWHALEQPRFAESDGGTEPDNADGQRCRPAEISEAGADSAGDPNALTAIRSCKKQGHKARRRRENARLARDADRLPEGALGELLRQVQGGL